MIYMEICTIFFQCTIGRPFFLPYSTFQTTRRFINEYYTTGFIHKKVGKKNQTPNTTDAIPGPASHHNRRILLQTFKKRKREKTPTNKIRFLP